MLYTVIQDAYRYESFVGPHTVATRRTLEAAESRAKELAEKRAQEWRDTHSGEFVQVRPMLHEGELAGDALGERYAWGVYTDDGGMVGESWLERCDAGRLIYTFSTDELQDTD